MRLELRLNTAGDLRCAVLRDLPVARREVQVSDALLVCSSKLQDLDNTPVKTVKVGFGAISSRHVLTRYAKQCIREAGALLDDGPRDLCVFLTGTLPGSTPEAVSALAAYSGWAVQTITQWLRDTTSSASWFGVWEYQRRGALHIHIAVRLATQNDARYVLAKWKHRWLRLLTSIASKTGIDIFGRKGGGSWAATPWMIRTDAQRVEKSVGCYLAKYLSKGSHRTRSLCFTPPSAWWFCQRTLRKRILEGRRLLRIDQLCLSPAVDLYQRVSALVAERASSAYCYVGKFDVCVKGIIGLFKPVQASLIFDELSSVLRCLSGSARSHAPSLLDLPTSAYLLFGGRQLADAVP